LLIKQKKLQIDNLLNKLSLYPNLEDIFIPKIKELKIELQQLNKDLNKSKDIIQEITLKEPNLSFMKLLMKNAL
jgi:hypothetical protein